MRILVAVFVIATIFVACPAESMGAAAPEAIYLCSVEYAGPGYVSNSNTPGTLIKVKVLSAVKETVKYWKVDGIYSFYAPSTMTREYLATALTAMVNSKQVYIRFAKATAAAKGVSLNYMCLSDYDLP